jgi:cytochrome P450
VLDLFSEEMRRNPYPAFDRLRAASPVVHLALFDLWMILDYDGVRRALTDHAVFSSDLSHVPGQGNPGEWFIFFDPPRHTRLRALISKAFTPTWWLAWSPASESCRASFSTRRSGAARWTSSRSSRGVCQCE